MGLFEPNFEKDFFYALGQIGYLAVIVTFYPSKPTPGVSATGFALENEQAARVVLAQLLARGTSVEDEVGEAMANGGVYVVAAADGARELTYGPSPRAARERPRGSNLGGRALGYR